MFSHCRRCVLVLPVLSLAVLLLAADVAPTKNPSAQEVAQWVRQLGDNSFTVREKASKKLWEAGEAAEAALNEAIKSEDAEVVRRARDILDKFKWGIYPNTSADVVALIHTYQASEGNTRAETLQKLLRAGPAGLQAVLKIARAETDPTLRRAMGELVAARLTEAFPQALEKNDFARFDALVELGHEGEVLGNNQYAAYWLLRGKLDERIAHFRSLLAKKPDEKWYAETLVYLHRAKGDLAEARAAAEKAGRADLVEGILYEQADWKALAARTDLAMTKSDIEKWAYRAAFARLADRPKHFETALGTRGREFEAAPPDTNEQFVVVKACFLNDRPTEGLSLLAKMPSRKSKLFDILCARLQFHEALALFDRPPEKDKPPQLPDLEMAKMLYFLGEKDKAKALFSRWADEIKDGVDPDSVIQLLQAEYRAGLKEEAFVHCAKALSVSPKNPEGTKAAGLFVNTIFPEQSQTADVWWSVLRQQFKDESAAMVLKRLRDLLEGKTPAKDVQAWIKTADRRLSVEEAEDGGPRRKGREDSEEGARQRRALAEVAIIAGLDELAHSLLEKANTPEALIRLGDLRAGKKQWAKAAEHYRQAWRTTRQAPHADPLPLYLAGDVLVNAGQHKEGRRLMEQSHWVLLGNAEARYSFLLALAKRGYAEAVRRETDLLMCACGPNDYYAGVALGLRAASAARRKDYPQAAEAYEQSMLGCLRIPTIYLQSASYVKAPSHAHQLRASALLAAGRLAEAEKQIELALADMPGDVDVPIALVPALERGGHKKEAAALFDRCYAEYEKVCRDYPRCASAHNSAAWMAACCRRNLDNALQHARQAVELAPEAAGYLDTLAEIYFQRGEKDKAVALQKRVVELDPKKKYFRKQLRRLEAGDASAERPPEDE